MGHFASCGKPSTSVDLKNGRKMKKLKKTDGTIVKKNRAENMEKEIVIDVQLKDRENGQDQ